MLAVHVALQAAVIVLQLQDSNVLRVPSVRLLLQLYDVFFVATGSFYPMILLCGILWPLEGMSTGLRYIALTLPFTLPSQSLRDIMEKGYTIADPSVYHGFLVTVAWTAVTLALCFLRLKYKKT
ncbi:hypothetical protein ACJJTC_014168 [Scirpophaga incertulas]